MWYWDRPPSGNYAKKPLTKKQLQKIQEAYKKGDMIAEHVNELEKKERKKTTKQITKEFNSTFI